MQSAVDGLSQRLSSQKKAKRRSKRQSKTAARKAARIVDSYASETHSVSGVLKKRAKGTGLWQKRWFILHGQFLSYLKREPASTAEFEAGRVGTIDMWKVEQVTVDGAEISIRMGTFSGGAGGAGGGAGAAGKDGALEGGRESSNNLKTSKASTGPSATASAWLTKALSMVGVRDEVVLLASDADTAQRWVQAMFVGAFAGEARRAFDAETSTITEIARHSLAADGGDPTVLAAERVDLTDSSVRREPELAVHALRVVDGGRTVFETKRLLGTRLALGHLPPSCRVELDLVRLSPHYVQGSGSRHAPGEGGGEGDALDALEVAGVLRSARLGDVGKRVPSPDGGSSFGLVLSDPSVALDAVRVVILQNSMDAAWHNAQIGFDAPVVAAAAAAAAALVAGPAAAGKVAGPAAAVGVLLSLLVALAAAVYLSNRTAAVLESVTLVPMSEAARAGHGRKSKRASKSKGKGEDKGKGKGKGKNRGDEEDEEDDEEDDGDEDVEDDVDAADVGDGAELTSKERAALVVLRERVADMLEPDGLSAEELYQHRKHIEPNFRLVRFLRARNLQVKKAEKLLRKAMAWRVALDTEHVHDWGAPPRWLLEYVGCKDIIALLDAGEDRRGWYFRDRSGQLALFLRNGRLNHRKMFRKMGGEQEAYFRLGVWLFETIQQDLDAHAMASNGEVNSQVTLVIDLAGFSMSNQLPVSTAVGMARKYVPKILDAFPEVLAHVVVINAPYLFHSLWSLFSPLFPQRVLDKIWIGGSSKSAQHRHISKIIAPDQTPVAYGGTFKLGDDIWCQDRVPSAGPLLPDKGAALLSKDDNLL